MLQLSKTNQFQRLAAMAAQCKDCKATCPGLRLGCPDKKV